MALAEDFALLDNFFGLPRSLGLGLFHTGFVAIFSSLLWLYLLALLDLLLPLLKHRADWIIREQRRVHQRDL